MTYTKQTWRNGDTITAAKLNHIEDGIASSGGLSSAAKLALLDCFAHVAWTDENGQDYYDALEEALYPPVPPAELVSISAVYTQSGTVYDNDSLDDLKADLVVTATYDDSTTEAVTTYTLSGTLTEGTSTITVSYGGKTTTFNVTVTSAETVEYIKQNYSKVASANNEVYEISNINFANGDYVEVSYTQESSNVERAPFRIGSNTNDNLWTYYAGYKFLVYEKNAGISQLVAIYNGGEEKHTNLESTYSGQSHVMRFDKNGVKVDGAYYSNTSTNWANLIAWFSTQSTVYCGLHKDMVGTYHYIKVVRYAGGN